MAQSQTKSFRCLGALPTGTVFLFQFLNPLLTDNWRCTIRSKIFSSALVGFCGFSCVISCFTDSYTCADGKIYHGIVTTRGLWPLPDPNFSSVDLSGYRLRFGDFVHAFLSVLVFAVVSLLDSNTVSCFYPSFVSNQKALFVALPPVIGTLASATFVIFPSNRRGVGYPSSFTSSS